MNQVRRDSLWAKDSLFVDASIRTDGAVTIEGQDLRNGEYEYFFTIKPNNVPALVLALGGAEGDDALELLKAQAPDLVHTGEMTWLKEHAIPYDFFSP